MSLHLIRDSAFATYALPFPLALGVSRAAIQAR